MRDRLLFLLAGLVCKPSRLLVLRQEVSDVLCISKSGVSIAKSFREYRSNTQNLTATSIP